MRSAKACGSQNGASSPKKRSGEEQSAEQARHRLHRQEEARFANDPALAVERDAAAGDDTMDMGMMGERLAPGVENREQTDLGAEALQICGERHGRLGCAAHQRGVEKPLVLEGDLGLARVEPGGSRRALAFWTMPVAAGVVGDASRAAIIALLDMAAERRRPARRDRAHDASFAAADLPCVIAKIGIAMAAEDVGELDRRPLHARSLGRRHLQGKAVQGALRPADQMRRDLRVARRRRQMLVAEQHLDDANVDAALQEMRREAVPQDMDAHSLVDASRRTRRTAGGVQDGLPDRLVLSRPGNKKLSGRARRQ